MDIFKNYSILYTKRGDSIVIKNDELSFFEESYGLPLSSLKIVQHGDFSAEEIILITEYELENANYRELVKIARELHDNLKELGTSEQDLLVIIENLTKVLLSNLI